MQVGGGQARTGGYGHQQYQGRHQRQSSRQYVTHSEGLLFRETRQTTVGHRGSDQYIVQEVGGRGPVDLQSVHEQYG